MQRARMQNAPRGTNVMKPCSSQHTGLDSRLQTASDAIRWFASIQEQDQTDSGVYHMHAIRWDTCWNCRARMRTQVLLPMIPRTSSAFHSHVGTAAHKEVRCCISHNICSVKFSRHDVRTDAPCVSVAIALMLARSHVDHRQENAKSRCIHVRQDTLHRTTSSVLTKTLAT